VKYLLLALVPILFCSCLRMTAPSVAAQNGAYYGDPPKNYESSVKEYMDDVLIDSGSAKYSNWSGPTKGYVHDFRGTFYGHKVCVQVNSKNRMGGYVGKTPFVFVFKNEDIVYYRGGTRPGTVSYDEDLNACRN